MFNCTESQLDSLQRLISLPRLTPYLNLAAGDRRKAIKLYERNSDLSESLWGVLQGLEIALRNSIHESMINASGVTDWHDCINLHPRQISQLDAAREELNRRSVPMESSRLVAQLSFGFWISLTGRYYDQELWVKRKLWTAFPHRRKTNRRQIFQRLESIRNLRNRIAHHEIILKLDLHQQAAEIVEATEWICPVTAEWIRNTTHFVQCFTRKYE